MQKTLLSKSVEYITFNYRENVHGLQVERTPEDFPYSYDAYLILRNNPNEKDMHCSYSDRMYQWDSEKYYSLKKKFVPSTKGDYWDTAKANEVEKFLREYFDKPKLKFIALEQACNVSNGFPLWIFHYSY